MSIIMPSGNNKLDWSPKGKMEKTASAGAVAEVDELLVAAKSVVKAQAIDICPENDVVPEIKDEAPAGEVPADNKPADIKEALEDVKDAVEKAEEVAGVKDEIEIEVEEVGNEKPDLGGTDIVVESKPEEMTACAAKKDSGKKDSGEKDSGEKDSGKKDSGKKDSGVKEASKKDEKKDAEKCDECKKTPCECKKEASTEPAMAKSASTPEEFCKFAMISPENKKKLKDYWVNALGYPADFVSLMIKDYEK